MLNGKVYNKNFCLRFDLAVKILKLNKKYSRMIKLVLAFVFAFSILNCVSVAQVKKKTKDSLKTYKNDDFKELDSSLRTTYPFIQFDQNNFQFYTDESPNWDLLYRNLDKMIAVKDRKLNFYHIGGSHLQADIYTHDVRTKLQTRWEGNRGERGFLFPFDLAKTNNPGNYEFSSSNSWKYYMSVRHDVCELDYGLLGAIVSCKDSVIDLHFRHDRTEVKPSFNKIRIYHNKGVFPFKFDFLEQQLLVEEARLNSELGYTDISFSEKIDAFDLILRKWNKDAYEVQLSGIQLKNLDPGISYTSIGVNGAALFTYLECGNFEEQLKQAEPDFFAFSVGTNDANMPYENFKPDYYKDNLEKMIQIVLRANPKCAILLTVPNDSYYKKTNLNKNTERVRDVIIELAIKYQCPVWDLYGLMGGLGSSKTWEEAGLMKKDLVHFTPVGYHLKGDIYYDAFLKWMDQMESYKDRK